MPSKHSDKEGNKHSDNGGCKYNDNGGSKHSDNRDSEHSYNGIEAKTLEKYRLAVRGFYVKNEWLMGSH